MRSTSLAVRAGRAVDPFPAGPSVAQYVPHRACEESIAYLSAKLQERPGLVAICGEAGTGRTLWLRVLLRRLSGLFEPVYVPSGAWHPADVASWVEAHSRRRRRRPLLIGCDDASEASEPLVQWFATRIAADHMRVVLTLGGRGQDPLSPVLRDAIETRVFTEPLSLAEARRHIETRLAEAGDELPPETVVRVALASRGNPGAIHRLGSAALAMRGATAEPLPGAKARAVRSAAA